MTLQHATPPPTTAGVSLRPADAVADAEHLIAVYASTRAEELAPVPWTAAEKDAFVRMQFAAQDTYWREQKPGATWDVVLVDGTSAGRLVVDRLEAEIRIVDIALLAPFRGVGAGTTLVRRLLAEGDVSGRPVTIHVERQNRARSLYDRLGFRPIGTTGVYDLLERRPQVSPS